MQTYSHYSDLSLQVLKCIDLGHFLSKVKANGYSTVALDQEVTDPKQIKKIDKSVAIEGLKTLSRITLVIENTASLHPLGQKQAPYQCDILAIKPANEKIFHAICTEQQNYDIITFDIGTKMPFMLKRNPVYEAIRKGKFFEIYYEPIFDESRRVVAMTNMINIIKATGGKNLIVSSNSSQGISQRTPYDVAALLISLGLDKNKALSTMKQNCLQLIRNSQHRLYLKGAIQQIKVDIGRKLNKRIKKHRDNIKNIYKHQKQQEKEKEKEKEEEEEDNK